MMSNPQTDSANVMKPGDTILWRAKSPNSARGAGEFIESTYVDLSPDHKLICLQTDVGRCGWFHSSEIEWHFLRRAK